MEVAVELDNIVSPVGKSSLVWKYFGYLRGQTKSSKALCKVCGGKVERAGGTSNLRSHLRTWHRSIYEEIYKDERIENISKQGTIDSFVKKVESNR